MKLGILCDVKDALTFVGRLANTIRRLTAERATTINDSKNLLILNRNSNCVSICFDCIRFVGTLLAMNTAHYTI